MKFTCKCAGLVADFNSEHCTWLDLVEEESGGGDVGAEVLQLAGDQEVVVEPAALRLHGPGQGEVEAWVRLYEKCEIQTSET